MHLQRQLGCPGLKQMDRWEQSDWIFSLPRIIFPVLAYGSTITLDVGREYCLYHTLSLALHPSSLPLPWLPHQLPSPTSIPFGISLTLFFFFISVPCGYLDTQFLWVFRQSFAMEPWLASNSKQFSCLIFLGVGIPGIHYLLWAW